LDFADISAARPLRGTTKGKSDLQTKGLRNGRGSIGLGHAGIRGGPTGPLNGTCSPPATPPTGTNSPSSKPPKPPAQRHHEGHRLDEACTRSSRPNPRPAGPDRSGPPASRHPPRRTNLARQPRHRRPALVRLGYMVGHPKRSGCRQRRTPTPGNQSAESSPR
jgi:hypothetical protein